jgi:hypothetical protein
MDIEGGEYEAIESTPADVLARFRIIVIEFHHLQRLDDRHVYKSFASATRKLLKDFRIVHMHPNNAGPVRSIGGVDCPCLLEITFARRDRIYEPAGTVVFPHPLDRRNADAPDIILPHHWRGAAAGSLSRSETAQPKA